MRYARQLSMLMSIFVWAVVHLPAQTDFRHCATKERQDVLFQQQPALAGWATHFEESYRSEKQTPVKILAEYTLPVVVHVIHNGGAENIPDAQILQGMVQLNQAFENEGGYASTLGVKTPFQFCLATRRPDSGPTTGINRIESETTDGSQFDQKVHELISWDTKNYINIWLVKEICTNAAGCDAAAYAYYPVAHGQVFDGMVVEVAYFGNSLAQSAVVAHEMGHYLGLLHTFEGGCENENCLATGDRVCDTPPDNSIVQNLPCNYGENSCNSDINLNDPYNPFTTNQPDFTDDFMDYGNLNCLTRFTQGQSDRMEFSLLNFRQSLLDSKGCGIPCPNPSTVAFNSNASFVEPSQTVAFTSITSNVTDLEWTMNDVPFSTAPNTSYTFTAEGDYIVKLTGSNGNALCDVVSFSKTIKVYCIANADFNGPPGSLLVGASFTFENISQNVTAYTWLVDGIMVGTSKHLTYPFYSAGIYEVLLQANNDNCSDERVRYVEVRDPCDDQANTFQRKFGYQTNCLARLSSGDYLVAGGTSTVGIISRRDTNMEQQWVKSVSNPTGYSMIYTSLSQGQNNEFFLGGETLSPDYQIKHQVLTKMKEDGQMLWHRIFESPNYDFLSGTTPLANGGVLAAFSNQQANSPYSVVAMDANGDQLWQKAWKPSSANTEIDINKLEPCTNGGFWMGAGIFSFGGGISSQAGIIKLDALGNQVWFKAYKNDAYRLLYALHLTELPDGGLLFVSRLFQAAPLDNGLALIRTNAEGNIVWAKKLQIKGYEDQIHWTKNIARKPNGHFAIAFHLYPDISAVLEITEDGEVAWQKYYKPDLYLEYNPGDIINDDEGYLISTLSPIGYSSIYRTNAFGNAGYCDQVPLKYNLENLALDIIPINAVSVNEPVFSQAFFPTDTIVNITNYDSYCQPTNQPVHVDIGIRLVNKKYCQGILEVDLEICNNGEMTIPDGLPISIYSQNPTLYATNIISSATTSSPLQAGECMTLTLFLTNPIGPQIFAVGNLMSNTPAPFSLGASFNAWKTECNSFDNLDSLAFWPYQPPQLSLGADTAICTDQPILLHAPAGFEALLWSDGSKDTTLLIHTEGLYWLVATDSCGASHSDSIVISLAPPSPPLDLGPDLVGCPSIPRTFSAGEAYNGYHWQDGSANSSFTAFQPGIYWVEVLDACSHLQSDTIHFIADAASSLDLGGDIVSCTNHSFLLDAGKGFEHYQWLPELEIDCTHCQQVTVTPTQSRTYLLIGETADGCIATDTVHFEIGQMGISVTLDTTICASDTFQINGQAMPPGSSQVFNLTAANGCDSTLLVIVHGVTVSLPPQLEIAFGDSVALVPVLGTEIPLSYNWSPQNGLSCVDCPEPIANVLADQVFILTVTDGQNCIDSTAVKVTIEKGPRPAYVANAFSPNDDGYNDTFTIYGDSRIRNIQLLRVFDRWGGLVFEDHHFAPGTTGWDGKSQGQIMSNGVYTYLAEVVWIDGKVEILSGEVVLLR